MDDERDGKQWEAYTDFETVVKSSHKTIVNARSAYAYVTAVHAHKNKMDRGKAIKAKTRIVDAVELLETEVEYNRDTEPFEEIWRKWNGSDDEEGYLSQLEDLNLEQGYPEWLGDLIDDVKRAGWHIGYLKVGRHEAADPEDDTQQVLEAIK